MGLMALTGRRPAEIFFSAAFSLPREKLPYPALLFDASSKPAKLPVPVSSHIPSPFWLTPRNLSKPSTLSRISRASFPRSRQHHHRPTTPQVRVRRLRLPRPPVETRTSPLSLRRHLLPQVQTQKPDRRYLPRPNPRPQTPGPNASLSVGQSYKRC